MLGAAWVPAPDAEAEPEVPPPANDEIASPLTAADWQGEPGTSGRPPAPLPLLPASRVVPAAVRALQWSHAGGLDLPRLLGMMAQRQLPQRLPLAQRSAAAPLRVLVLDFSGGLEGFRADMQALCRTLSRPLGGTGWQVRVLVDSQQPLAGWTDHTPRPRGPAASPGLLPVRPWQTLPPEARLLLVSELGLAGGSSDAGPPPLPPAWRRWFSCVRAQGAGVQVWSPLPLRAAAAGVPPFPVLHWSAAGAPRPQPLARGQDHATPERLELAHALLAALAFCPWIDPALVRAMRLAIAPGLRPALARYAHDAGVEQLVWQSPDLTRGLPSRRMRPERLASHCEAFERLLSPAQQQQVLQVAVAHYRQFSQPLVHMHTQGWVTRAARQAQDTLQVQQLQQQAQRFVARLVGPFGQTGVSALETRLFLHTWLHHGDARQQQQGSQRGAALAKALAHWESSPPSALALPAGALHADLARQLAPDAPQRTRWLLHDARSGQLLLSDTPAASGQSALWAHPLQMATADFQPGQGAQRRWLDLGQAQLPLLPGQGSAAWPALLRSTQGGWWLGAVRRPSGVLGWHRSAAGLHLSTQPCGRLQLHADPQSVELLPPRPGRGEDGLRVQVPPLPAGDPDARMGIGPDHGLYLDLDIAGVVQRFVWIEPTGPQGFVMGSPDGEQGRDVDESPQHRVVLSRGYWLADTPCTQALWVAVVGLDNPSHFKEGEEAPQRPVEQVNYDEVQGFLAALGRRLQGLGVEAMLPTEAQWEHACRAGSTTAYAWGDELESGKANIDSEGTTVVKLYAPNDWGLFDMHGNVWEWCADGMCRYDGSPQRDPEGGDEGGSRVVRGGAWDFPAAWARSAYRGDGHRSGRVRNLGFRFALRSSGPGGQPEGPGGPGFGRGAPQGTESRPEGAPRRRSQS